MGIRMQLERMLYTCLDHQCVFWLFAVLKAEGVEKATQRRSKTLVGVLQRLEPNPSSRLHLSHTVHPSHPVAPLPYDAHCVVPLASLR